MGKKVNGLIAYYNLGNWWLTAFTDAERQYIEATFIPFGLGAGTLTQGRIDSSSQSADELLRSLASWFRDTDQDATIAARLRAKADEFDPRETHIHRRKQLLELIHLRPFWQKCGSCDDPDDYLRKKTLLANDPFWDSADAPWNCVRQNCQCRVNSLSRIEMKRYVEAGCSPGDEAAAQLLEQIT
jgi:hypothetical protein